MTRITQVKPIEGSSIDPARAEQIFDLIERFASYGFNKSHAAAYAVISFRTAWLKRHYPHEFFSSSMNMELGTIEKIADHCHEARRQGLVVLNPDVNRSAWAFTVTRHGPGKAILWALAGIKGVGEKAMQELVAAREAGGPFRSLTDLIERVGPALNKKRLESLIKAGACDSLHRNRRAMLEGLDRILRQAHKQASEKASGQGTLFGDGFAAIGSPQDDLPAVADYPPRERLQMEYEVLGLFLTGHPLADAVPVLCRKHGWMSLAQATDRDSQDPDRGVVVAGIIHDLTIRTTKSKGEAMARVLVSDPSRAVELTVFPKVFARHRDSLKMGAVMLFTCSREPREGEIELYVDAVEPLDLERIATAGRRLAASAAAPRAAGRGAERQPTRSPPSVTGAGMAAASASPSGPFRASPGRS